MCIRDRKTTSRSPRSTVGTITEIYDYLRVLYASIGVPHCPNCGQEISRQTTDQILEQVRTLGPQAVSYTHLDVYKRQAAGCLRENGNWIIPRIRPKS